jgi:hypothetical protein
VKTAVTKVEAEDEAEDVVEEVEVEAEEDAVEADTEEVTEDLETVKEKTITITNNSTIILTKTMATLANKLTATELDQRHDEAASDHEVVFVVEAEAVEVEADEAAEDEAEAGPGLTKASLVTTRPRLRLKPKTKKITSN